MDADVRERLEAREFAQRLRKEGLGEDNPIPAGSPTPERTRGIIQAYRNCLLKAADTIDALLTQPVVGRETLDDEIVQQMGALAYDIEKHDIFKGARSKSAAAGIRRLLSHLSPGAPEGWREIDSAPKDGTRLWLYQPDRDPDARQYIGWWQNDFPQWEGWQDNWDSEPAPTHWRPLPQSPAALTSSSSDQQDFRVSRDHAPSTCAALDWRPIDTAPTDGTPLLLICASAYSPTATEGWWMNGHGGEGWYHYSRPEEKWHGGVVRWFPTHWMPMPPLSSQTEVPGERSRDANKTTPSSSSGVEREAERLISGASEMAARIGREFVVDPDKLAKYGTATTPKGEGEDGGARPFYTDEEARRQIGNLEAVALERTAEIQRLREALDGFADDYMTSEKHHPGYVLIPTEKFERIRSALGDDQGGAS